MHATTRLRSYRADVDLRPDTPADATACGRIMYEAFATIASAHGFPRDFPNVESTTSLASALLRHPRVYSVIAEQRGRIVGSNFLHEHGPVSGVGPITIDPRCQDARIGRRLMTDVLARAEATGTPGVRLVQAAYHARSLSLYAKLGFDAREPLAVLQGPALDTAVPGHHVRPATVSDVPACDNFCRAVHGHDRHGEIEDAVAAGTALVAERAGRITAYSTSIAYMGHTVAETNDGLKALIGASASFGGPGFLLPIRNAELFRWCLGNGLRVMYTMTLMSRGLYNEPAGASLPSVIF
jgi:predicted N-acetyltransferase YhbS